MRSRKTSSAKPKIRLPLDESASTPREVWDDYFSKRSPSRRVVGELILRLHKAGKHEQVIAAIEAALLNGQSQPWMYDVLALSMRIADRPKAEVERVLMSRIDWTATDVPSMLYSAAYLTRFHAYDRALNLYRQASRLSPTRPEPYVLGLKLARRAKDYEGIQWAAAGILTSAWTEDHKRLHRDAENAALEAGEALLRAGRDEDAARMKAAMDEARKRDLVLRLTWSGNGELDMIVEEPRGTVCSYQSPQSPGGGVLVHDGYGPNQKNCYEEYICAFGVPGNYRVRIRHVWGNIVGKRARLTIIRYQGTSEENVQSYPLELSKRDTLVRVALPRGRRTQLAPVERTEVVVRTKRGSGSLLQKLGRMNAGSRRVARQFGASRRIAAAQQANGPGVGFSPVITTLSEGVTMSALAVVSGDRRYVRISTAPAFTAITDVFTFSFVNSGNPNGNPGVGGGGGGNNQGNNPGRGR